MQEEVKKARQALAEDDLTREAEISLRLVGGVAFLNGMVESAEVKERAEELVGKVEGIRLVRNRLQVRKLRSEERKERFIR